MFSINWNAFAEQITDEEHEELNTSTMTTEVQAKEEEQAEEEEQGGPTRMETKSPVTKRVPVSYPDEIALKIIDAWRDSPHLYKKEHEGYLPGYV